MDTIDYIFLGGFAAALGLMLVCSKVIRVILWDILRHPFTRSRIEVCGDEVKVRHEQKPPAQTPSAGTAVGAR
jgi:hypothetical protein